MKMKRSDNFIRLTIQPVVTARNIGKTSILRQMEKEEEKKIAELLYMY
jgi:hypothetical protein